MEKVVNNPKFLYSALKNFGPSETKQFFENWKTPLKVERGSRIFPLSDKASDITNALVRACKKEGVVFKLSERVLSTEKNNDTFILETSAGNKYKSNALIIATGGKSYSATGSDGDGWVIARNFGHTITEIRPALVPIKLKDSFIPQIEGLSLKNIMLTSVVNNKIYKSLLGEIVFTNDGISGPITLTMSSYINRFNENQIRLYIDFKPALSIQVLSDRVLRECESLNNKQIATVIKTLLPRNLVNIFLERLGLNPIQKVNAIKKEQREQIVRLLKKFELGFNGLYSIENAIITSGGVCVDELNPKTMESKYMAGLFFVGEVIDIDALTGGFNIQIALSTGSLAGESVS